MLRFSRTKLALIAVVFAIGVNFYSQFSRLFTVQNAGIHATSLKNRELSANLMAKANDPCSDFYAYSCGGFSKIAKSSKAYTFRNVGQMIEQRINNDILDILNASSSSAQHQLPKLYDKTVSFFKSCLDEIRTNSTIAQLAKIAHDQGSFIGRQNNLQLKDLQVLLLKLREKFAVEIFAQLQVKPDPFNANGSQLAILQPQTTLFNAEGRVRTKWELDEPIGEDEVSATMQKVAQLTPRQGVEELRFGGLLSREDVRLILAFDRELERARQARPSVEVNLKQFLKTADLTWLKEKSPALDWDSLLGEFSDRQFFVVGWQYLVKMSQLVTDWMSGTPQRRAAVYNYALLQLHTLNSFSMEMQDKRKSDSMKCISILRNLIDEPLGILWLQQHQPPIERKSKLVRSMWNNVKAKLHTSIENLSWLDDSSLDAALKVLDSKHLHIETSPSQKNEASLVGDYMDFEVSRKETSFLKNLVTAKRFKQSLKEKLAPPFELHHVVSAYQSILGRVLVQPGLLHAPQIYDPASEEDPNDLTIFAINFGSMGTTLARELSKAFVDFKFVKEDSLEMLRTKKACYAKLLQSQSDLAEFITQTIGLNVAHETFRSLLPKAISPNNLLKMDRLFFLGFAQSWCSIDQTGNSYLGFSESVRVNKAVMNSATFHEAYQCSKVKHEICSFL